VAPGRQATSVKPSLSKDSSGGSRHGSASAEARLRHKGAPAHLRRHRRIQAVGRSQTVIRARSSPRRGVLKRRARGQPRGMTVWLRQRPRSPRHESARQWGVQRLSRSPVSRRSRWRPTTCVTSSPAPRRPGWLPCGGSTPIPMASWSRWTPAPAPFQPFWPSSWWSATGPAARRTATLPSATATTSGPGPLAARRAPRTARGCARPATIQGSRRLVRPGHRHRPAHRRDHDPHRPPPPITRPRTPTTTPTAQPARDLPRRHRPRRLSTPSRALLGSPSCPP